VKGSREASDRAAALARLRPWVDKARRFSGWDFPGIQLRELESGLPWDYEGVVRNHAAEPRNVFDLGTGGGERLARLRPQLPERIVATEEWDVNAPVAFRRLAPLQVHVVRAKSVRLPVKDASFDLVVDRHEEFDPEEVARVLAPGGSFVTQQVGQHDWIELRRFFPRMIEFGDQRSAYSKAFLRRGFAVESVEHDRRVAYPSLGELTFMLLVTPWTIPDFDVERDLDALLAFESEQLAEDGVVVTECRYLIRARKPA